MVRSPAVSAFAVTQALRGKHKLDKEVTAELVKKVKKIHEDERLNRNAEKVATNYERNLLTSKKKKNKRKEAKKKSLAASVLSPMPQVTEVAPSPQQPLSWHNAPKSDKRIKLTVSSDMEELQPLRGKKKGRKSVTNGDSNHLELEQAPLPKSHDLENTVEEDHTLPASLEGVLPLRSNGKGPMKEMRKKKTPATKKAKVKQWVPPTLRAENGHSMMETVESTVEEAAAASASTKLHLPPTEHHVAPAPLYTSAYDDDEEEEESGAGTKHTVPEEVANHALSRLLDPVGRSKFFSKYWLKKPLHIPHLQGKSLGEDIFSKKELDRILKEEGVRFGVNIDITSYVNGKRETAELHGRAYPTIVDGYYEAGHSVRLLNPQTYSTGVWKLLANLQESFGSMMGANVYLTPAGTQGFAPHYDDIEAFVLQLEGKKHWKVYKPRISTEKWPLTSSANFSQDELGEQVIDCVLKPGDLLYMPRGFTHQAKADEDVHSLHITLSTHQQNTWSNLFREMLPAALNELTDTDPEFRESLPKDYLNYTGIAFQDPSLDREAFMNKVFMLMRKLMMPEAVDDACDVLAKKFIHDSLPPYLTPVEKARSIVEQENVWTSKDDIGDEPRLLITMQVEIRLLRKHSVRIVNESAEEEEPREDNSDDEEQGSIKIYYNTDNDRLYHGNEPQYFVVNEKLAMAIEWLQKVYPDFARVLDIPGLEVHEKVDLAQILYDYGLLITNEPVTNYIDSEREETIEVKAKEVKAKGKKKKAASNTQLEDFVHVHF